MTRIKHGCVWLIGLFAFAWLGVALLRSHFETVRQAREDVERHDRALDRTFNARKPAPLEVRVMISTPDGSYQVPADQPSFQKRIEPYGKRPAILVLTGCSFPVWGKDVPRNVAVLSVGENHDLLDRKTVQEACSSRRPSEIAKALEQSLSSLGEYVERSKWIDKDRVMIVGYGEAAPLVASYIGPAKQRLTLGDPCVVPWRGIKGSAPLVMLFTSDPQGLVDQKGPVPKLDIRAIASGSGPTFPRVEQCPGLARPKISQPARQIVAAGTLGLFKRPAALLSAQKSAYDSL